jgi:hypothetical protein
VFTTSQDNRSIAKESHFLGSFDLMRTTKRALHNRSRRSESQAEEAMEHEDRTIQERAYLERSRDAVGVGHAQVGWRYSISS